MSTYAVIDLETTGNSPGRGDKIIEVGIVIMKEKAIVEEFSSFIYPETPIPSFITRLTGITDEDVIDAPLLSEVVPELKRLLAQDYIVAHNIDFDMKFMNDALAAMGESPIDAKVLDTVELSRIMLPDAPGHKLSDLSESLSLTHDQPHRAISDALVTADLWSILYTKMEDLPEKTLTYLLKLSSALKSDVKGLIDEFLLEKRYNGENARAADYEVWEGIPVRPQKNYTLQREDRKSLLDWEDWKAYLFRSPEGLPIVIDKYREREEQERMADSIHQSFSQNRLAFIEAGAGIGKSMASAVSALHTSLLKEKRVLISTYTNALQSQIMQKELPQLQAVSPVPFTFASLKGSEHYLSLAHFRYEMEYGTLDNYDDVLTKAMLLIWVLETETGDVEEVQLPSNGYKFWRKVSADQKGKAISLSMGNYSYYHKAYEKAKRSDIVVTTHALFCFDLLQEEEFIPACQYAIIDEAHHLKKVASKYFGTRLYYPAVQQLFSQWRELFEPGYYRKSASDRKEVSTLLQSCYTHLDNAKAEWTELSAYFANYVVKHRPSVSSDTGKVMFDFRKYGSKRFYQTLMEMCERLLQEMKQLIRKTESLMNEMLLQLQMNEDKDLTILITRLDYQVGYYKEFVSSVETVFIKEDTNPVWAELDIKHPQGTLTIECESYTYSDQLAERLQTQKDSIVFTSATLAAQGSFDFMKKSLGLEEGREVIIPSPFDFEKQMKVVVPTDMPHIKQESEDFLYAVAETILSIAIKTHGRMLVLFTSYAMLRNVYHLLKEFQELEQYQLIAQGITSGSRDRLKKEFQTLDHAILLGTNTFWEGIDIPGEDLSCLVMVRLPFDPPSHPGQQIEENLWKSSNGNPFMEMVLPKAILRFKQGIGRLIRGEEDKGIVVILDKRIVETSYGKYFIEALPTSSIQQCTTKELLANFHELLPIDDDERNN
ncbi:ATP-dependent DNA helicase DinG [Salimicrobium halophilum]|uniref:3'-5' exonuclease DinG n=1 Tax=Salimicrobium halophilum TaxID=86666 RepID=A0A1G8Q1Q6_9BACI|nr:ATP-dependent DNA helicase DinG [Salimicrobium halophilum]SDI98647.1 ATP-dependent DNA helicase DinG [Salimicrobium halophilum]